mmetsp:Transcript_27401/g.74304  ORF Transcript_27401/g.74304 Transcript_27401/m.74304 type:complete len:657 (+) Transcript_27401:1573-3543(+)
MSSEAAGSVILSLVQDMVNEPFEEAIRFVRLDNSKGAVARLKDMVYSKETAEILLDKLVAAGALTEDSPACHALEGGLDLEAVKEADLTSAYRLFLADSLNEGADDYDQDSVAIMGELLSMTPEKTVSVYNEVCGPMLRARLAEGIAADDLGEDAKKANQAFVAKLQIPAQVYEEVTAELYKNKLAACSGGGKIMTLEERSLLDKMREFLDLPLEKCQKMHRVSCAGAYVQAVQEAMGAGGSGVINTDYYAGLTKLADRLLLGEDDQRALFNDAVKARLQPMMDELLSQFERSVLNKQQLAQKTGKDQGEDLIAKEGGGALGLESGANMMLEVVNMVDFYEGNNLWEGTTDEATNATTYTYRVDAKGMAEEKMLEEVYRQFTVSSFQARGSPGQQKRYALAQTHFAGILGIGAEREAEIKQDIGKVVYSNYVKQLLTSKGRIEQQDMQFLVNIQQVLKMEDEFCFELLGKLQKNFLREQIDKAIGGASAGKITGELAKSVRDRADSMGIDVREELKLDMTLKSDLFLAEVESAIKSKAVTVDNKELIEDFQDAWGIPNDVATKDFTRMVEAKCIAGVKSASQDLNNSNERSAVRYIDELLGYAQFIPQAVQHDAKVSKADKEKVLATYTAAKASFDGDTDPEVTARLELLSTVLGL